MYWATEWLYNVERALPGQVQANWRYFSLHQINYTERDTWKIWEQPLKGQEWKGERYAASLRYLWSAEAARQQGEQAFRRFHLALLREIHQYKKDLTDPETALTAARKAGLDLARFQEDIADPSCLERLARDYTTGVSKGVFGTPTFVFPAAEPAYLKLKQILTPKESLDFWEEFRSIVVDRPYVLEIKRPQ